MKKWLAAAGVVLMLVGTGWGWLGWREVKWLNPLSPKEVEKEEEMEVIGFLPTWMVGKTQNYSKEIDQLIFLGIGVSEDGSLIWEPQANKVRSDDYLKLKKSIKNNGGKNILGIKQFEDERLGSLIGNEAARRKLIEELRSEVRKGGFDGVNVDFEFMNDPFWVLGPEFVGFIDELKSAGLGEISVDVFANTIIKGDSEKIKNLNNIADKIIVMAYDFHRPGVDFAGAVAPVGAVPGERCINEVVERAAAINLDKKKIVLAYPLYGYEFKTESRDLGAKTSSKWGQMVSYKRAKDLIKNVPGTNDTVVMWDELSQTPYLSFVENETRYKTVWVTKYRKKTTAYTVAQIHQVYYEDLRSVKIKVDLAVNNKFGGIGFWALGYEGQDAGVWKLFDN